jgi:CPA1 family monovalent cation:H+ antiporter
LHMSGPIAVVVAGILIGNRGPVDAMSDQTQRFLFGFWNLIDEILNSVLFLLIGLEVLVLRFDMSFIGLGLSAVPLTLLARFVSVGLPVLMLGWVTDFTKGTVRVLTWGGLRGGISVALALAPPESDIKTIILAATYAVVVFTIVVQGLTLAPLVKRIIN